MLKLDAGSKIVDPFHAKNQLTLIQNGAEKDAGKFGNSTALNYPIKAILPTRNYID